MKANKYIYIYLGLALAIIVSALALWYFCYGYYWQDKMFGTVYLNQDKISSLSRAQLQQFIDAKTDQLNRGFKFCLEGDCLELKDSADAGVQGLSLVLYEINRTASLSQIFDYGRNGNFFKKFSDRLASLMLVRRAELNFSYNQELIEERLRNYFDYRIKKVVEADLVLVNDQLTVSEEETGLEIDYNRAVEDLVTGLANGDNTTINLNLIRIEPKIRKSELLNVEMQAEAVLNFLPITWKYQERTWTTDAKQARTWLGLELSDKGRPQVVLSEAKLRKYLTDEIGQVVNVAPVEPKFTISNNRIFLEENAKTGEELDLDVAVRDLFTAVQSGQKEITLTMKQMTPQATDKILSDLEVVELVGVGTSSYAGSPANRRHNIKVGSDSLNGILIKPGEEFSLLKALGAIDRSGGYLQELVIKDNKTIPEYGGGLCQVGTTLFRAVVNAGLPVTARRNHSYRVQYYEPAGTDATIYDPAPDFRFINDSPNSLIIKTRIVGSQAIYEFWGKRDGRIVKATYPTIYNIVKPGATKIIESTDLKPGERKCTERAHNGADAFFDYTVTYSNGEVKETRFSSHYVPWREVCLVGVGTTSASSTPSVGDNTLSAPLVDTISPDDNQTGVGVYKGSE